MFALLGDRASAQPCLNNSGAPPRTLPATAETGPATELHIDHRTTGSAGACITGIGALRQPHLAHQGSGRFHRAAESGSELQQDQAHQARRSSQEASSPVFCAKQDLDDRGFGGTGELEVS